MVDRDQASGVGGQGLVISVRAAAAFLGFVALMSSGAAQEAADTASWATPKPQAVRADLWKWFNDKKLDEAALAKAEAAWPVSAMPAAGEEILERLVATVAAVDDRVAAALKFAEAPSGSQPDLDWLKDEKTPPLVRANVRLQLARRLAHREMFDEVLEQLAGLNTSDVVDPASLLFYRAVAEHRLLRPADCIASTAELLENASQSPRRYIMLARMMQKDIAGVKKDSLDHISRRMDDVSRRLGLGRAGPKVRKVEDGVIESLDKLIKKMEEDQQNSTPTASVKSAPGEPMRDSRPGGGKGEGKIDRKPIGSGRGWGDLPPKQREEALQRIGDDFPAHYREVIEEYFRRLANPERE
jgi:hypothetical protein